MRILFIDDDRRRMRTYVQALVDQGFEVLFEDNIDSALTTLHSQPDFNLIILDISMPSGAAFRFEDNVGGTRTGLVLYDTIRAEWPNVKVVILTNMPDPRVAEHIDKDSKHLRRLVRKPEVLPFQFAQLVSEFLAEIKVQ